jgi:hypothetical protein
MRGSHLQVKGHVEYDGRRLDQPQLAGKWDARLAAVFAGGAEQLLWAKHPPHEHPSRCICIAFIRHVLATPCIRPWW